MGSGKGVVVSNVRSFSRSGRLADFEIATYTKPDSWLLEMGILNSKQIHGAMCKHALDRRFLL